MSDVSRDIFGASQLQNVSNFLWDLNSNLTLFQLYVPLVLAYLSTIIDSRSQEKYTYLQRLII